MGKMPTPEVSPLFIDKISLTGKPVQDIVAFRHHAESVVQHWKSRGHVILKPKWQGHRYHTTYVLVDGDTHICLVQLDPNNKKIGMFRLEFNPTRLNQRERNILRKHLEHLFLASFDEIMSGVKITAADMAVDISHVEFYTLMVTENPRRKSGAWGKDLGADGEIGTFYLGAKRSDEHAKIYNKRTQIIAETGRDPGQEFTRVEVTIRPRVRDKKTGTLRHGIYLNEFHLLPNPFARVELSSLPAAQKYGNDYRWKLFLGCCEARGVQGALGCLPDHKRPLYHKRVSSGAFGWWQPTARWKGLTTVLKNVGIFPDSAFEKPVVDDDSAVAE